MINHGFFDPDAGNNNIAPKSEVDSDELTLCDDCGNIVLKPYQNDRLICPKCLKIYNPYFEIIQRKDLESTIEDDAVQGSGVLTYAEEQDRFKHRITINRKKLEKEQEPEYVKQDIEAIYHRLGYKQVKLDKKFW